MNINLDISFKTKDLLSFNRSDLVFLNLFWIGFLIYTFCFVLLTTKQVNYNVFQLLQGLSLILILFSASNLVRFKFENEYLKFFFILFVFWAFIIFLRGFSVEFTKEVRNAMFFNAWFGGFIYFVPWIMLFPKKLIFYKKLFIAINISGVFYLIISFLYIDLLLVEGKDVLSQAVFEYFSKTLAISAFFILFTYKYHSTRITTIAILVIFFTFIFTAYRARRGLLFMMVIGMVFLFIINFIKSDNKFKYIIISLSFFFFTIFITIGIVIAFDLDLFGFLIERGAEDTRSVVERYFFKDMKDWDWVFGRGMFGEYFSPSLGVAEDTHRGTIETDYLNMILKGGGINLGLLILIIIPAIILGIFYSKNTLTLAFGFWLLFWSLSTYPATVQVFSLNYLLVWIGIGACYSKFIRNFPDAILVKYFRS